MRTEPDVVFDMTSESLPELPSHVWAKVFEQVLPRLPYDESRAVEFRKREQMPSDTCDFQAMQQLRPKHVRSR